MVEPSTHSSRLRTWLQLVRAPNLFTVPGDPLAGYLLANSGWFDFGLPLVMLASLCFYAAGLLMNDLADEEEDRRERPNRPLPSGAASRTAVRNAVWFLNALGLAASALTGRPMAFAAGFGVMASVWLYNRATKHIPGVGAVNMGLCRSLSVLLGGCAGPLAMTRMSALAAIAIGGYIAAVTNLARHETRDRVPFTARLLPSIVAILGCLAGIRNAIDAPAKLPAAAIFVLVAGMVLYLAVRVFQGRTPLPPLIGAHIRILLVLQAAICWFADPWAYGPVAAAVLLICWPISRIVSKRFYAS